MINRFSRNHLDKVKADAIARARAEIAQRVGRFCKNLSREEFDALLDRMAGIQYKYEYLQNAASEERTAESPQSLMRDPSSE